MLDVVRHGGILPAGNASRQPRAKNTLSERRRLGQSPAMLAAWIARMRLRSAARRYARRLGPRLRHDYGAGERYTPGQIRTAAARCKLPARFLCIGFAAFLPEEVYRATVDQAFKDDRAALRNVFRSYLSSNPTWHAEERSDGGTGPTSD